MSTWSSPLARMKALALGLLLLAAALYALAVHLLPSHPGWGYLAAFAEAAMVGAIADWFAVTALFRHPLGLPIPHTAIIPRKQARLGRNLADFICTHFLATPQVMAKLEAFDAAARLAGWLRLPANAEALGRQLVGVARYGLHALRDERVRQFIQRSATRRLRELDLAHLAGQLLDMLTYERRHQAMLDELLAQLDALLQDEAVQQRIAAGLSSEFSALRFRLFGRDIPLDEKAGQWSADKLVRRVSELIGEISRDPQHELRGKFDACLLRFVARLKDDPAFRLKGEQIREQLLAHPALSGYLRELWDDLVDWLQADLTDADSTIRRRLVRLCQRLGEALARDAAMRRWINDQLLEVAPRLVERHREDIRRYIAERVERWNSDELVALLEHNVGKDLQYIRINGTLVGGMVGLGLHALTRLLAG
ncbi:DUF445 domain-containing protein [Pseudomonas sp. GCM10022188]|uniref:DUF445 domain-containing protein n=1 Tax=Pseudomonas TaxID=286 RepID=UPI001E49B2E2|nr:DUF445 domain-containing protein [Pseudomonas oryzagri]MCC6073782.1 DUF445 domain-containing protein [Pseudomonas oryzagri]